MFKTIIIAIQFGAIWALVLKLKRSARLIGELQVLMDESAQSIREHQQRLLEDLRNIQKNLGA